MHNNTAERSSDLPLFTIFSPLLSALCVLLANALSAANLLNAGFVLEVNSDIGLF